MALIKPPPRKLVVSPIAKKEKEKQTSIQSETKEAHCVHLERVLRSPFFAFEEVMNELRNMCVCVRACAHKLAHTNNGTHPKLLPRACVHVWDRARARV